MKGTSDSSAPRLTLDITPQMLTTLERLAGDSGQPLDAVFTKAIALYKAALEATRDGKHIGVASDPEALDVEFTGLSASESR